MDALTNVVKYYRDGLVSPLNDILKRHEICYNEFAIL